jgi:hypothetical protein
MFSDCDIKFIDSVMYQWLNQKPDAPSAGNAKKIMAITTANIRSEE